LLSGDRGQTSKIEFSFLKSQADDHPTQGRIKGVFEGQHPFWEFFQFGSIF